MPSKAPVRHPDRCLEHRQQHLLPPDAPAKESDQRSAVRCAHKCLQSQSPDVQNTHIQTHTSTASVRSVSEWNVRCNLRPRQFLRVQYLAQIPHRHYPVHRIPMRIQCCHLYSDPYKADGIRVDLSLQSACSATSRPVNMPPSGHTWHTQQLLQSKNAATAAL